MSWQDDLHAVAALAAKGDPSADEQAVEFAVRLLDGVVLCLPAEAQAAWRTVRSILVLPDGAEQVYPPVPPEPPRLQALEHAGGALQALQRLVARTDDDGRAAKLLAQAGRLLMVGCGDEPLLRAALERMGYDLNAPAPAEPAPALPAMTTHGLLQTLWTRAAGTPGYDKRLWRILRAVLEGKERSDLDRSVGEWIPPARWGDFDLAALPPAPPAPCAAAEDSGEIPTGPPRPFSRLRWPALQPLAEQLRALDDRFADPRIAGGGGSFGRDLVRVGLEGDPLVASQIVAQFLPLHRAIPCLWASVNLVLQLVEPETEAQVLAAETAAQGGRTPTAGASPAPGAAEGAAIYPDDLSPFVGKGHRPRPDGVCSRCGACRDSVPYQQAPCRGTPGGAAGASPAPGAADQVVALAEAMGMPPARRVPNGDAIGLYWFGAELLPGGAHRRFGWIECEPDGLAALLEDRSSPEGRESWEFAIDAARATLERIRAWCAVPAAGASPAPGAAETSFVISVDGRPGDADDHRRHFEGKVPAEAHGRLYKLLFGVAAAFDPLTALAELTGSAITIAAGASPAPGAAEREDAADAAVARQRLREIDEDPARLIAGEDLRQRLEDLRQRSPLAAGSPAPGPAEQLMAGAVFDRVSPYAALDGKPRLPSEVYLEADRLVQQGREVDAAAVLERHGHADLAARLRELPPLGEDSGPLEIERVGDLRPATSPAPGAADTVLDAVVRAAGDFGRQRAAEVREGRARWPGADELEDEVRRRVPALQALQRPLAPRALAAVQASFWVGSLRPALDVPAVDGMPLLRLDSEEIAALGAPNLQLLRDIAAHGTRGWESAPDLCGDLERQLCEHLAPLEEAGLVRRCGEALRWVATVPGYALATQLEGGSSGA